MKEHVSELRRLRGQIELALYVAEQLPSVEMSLCEKWEHDRKYGLNAFLVGDYVIRRRG